MCKRNTNKYGRKRIVPTRWYYFFINFYCIIYKNQKYSQKSDIIFKNIHIKYKDKSL